MSVLIIYPQLESPRTGGQIYDFNFIKLLKGRNVECNYLLDKDLGNGNSLFYLIKYAKKCGVISKNEIILTNSRLYPRLLFLFLVLKSFSNSKIIVFHHHFNFLTQRGLRRYVHKYLELLFLRMVDVAIIPSPYICDLMRQYCPKTKIEYLEIPFKKEKKCIDVLERKCTGRLLFVGSIEPRKGVEYLINMAIRLAKKNVKFHLTIVGNIPSDSIYYDSLVEMLKKENIVEYVTFTGKISEQQLECFYRESNIFTFPSLHEGYGMVLIEAMSYGLPVVAFNNSAMPYSVKPMKNGLLANNKDVEDFTSKVLLLLNDNNVLNKLSRGALETYNSSYSVVQYEKKVFQFIDRYRENFRAIKK